MPRKPLTASVADDHAAPGGAAAVDRALTLLAAFRTGDQALSLAELAGRTQLYKSTTLRLLASLEHARLVQRLGDGRYALGVEVARLHGIYASANTSLDHVVLPVLQDLVAATGESAAYHVLRGDAQNPSRLCLYRVDSPHPIRDHVKAGDLLPVDRGAGARVLMAFSLPQTKAAKTDQALYAQIRADGYCALVGDRSAELAGISAPVFKSDGTLAAAVTLTMPAHRYTLAHLAPVEAAARRLTGLI